jgi:hypothetical protein
VLGLLLHLQHLGLAEGLRALLPAARLVHGLGQGHPAGHPPERVATAVGQSDALLPEGHGPPQFPKGQSQLAEVVRDNGSILPVLQRDVPLQPSLHRRHRLHQPTQSTQADSGLMEDEGLIRHSEASRGLIPRVIEEACQRCQVGTKGPEIT